MAGGFSRKQLFILITLSCVAVLFFESWLIWRQNTRESKNLLKNGDEHRNDITYESFKPDTCLIRKLKPHCFGSNARYLNQSRDIDQACFPEEVVFRDIGLDDPNLLPTDEILPMEKETMNDPEYIDMFKTVSFDKSEIIVEEPNRRRHLVGDVIRVRVHLVNRSGKQRTLGGDDVRVLMISQDTSFRISGEVTDLKNGSYQVKFQALREGNHTVLIVIPYTREMRATMFKCIRRHKTLLYYFGLFKLNGTQEFTLCSPYTNIPGSMEVCNFTTFNDDLPWFCGRPVTPELHCDTIVESVRLDYAEISANYAQYSAFFRSNLNSTIRSNILIYIHKGQQWKNSKKINCNRIKARDTWNTTISTGYVYKQQWIQQNCKNTVTRKTAVSCLVNTTLILTGDSTVRQWLRQVIKFTKCVRMPLKWLRDSWADNAIYTNKHLNITIIWAPHVLPFVFARKLPDGKMHLKSISTHLKQLSSSGRIIFLIHLYSHFLRQHYSLFAIHIRSLKPAIRDALKRNKDLKLAIKSPHMFYRSPCLPILNDLQAPIFIDIIQQEFNEFKEPIIYLNYWEINHALLNDLIHPPYQIVGDNIKHFLGFVC